MANFKGGFAFNNEAAKVEVEQAPDGTLISCVNPVTGESLGGGGGFSQYGSALTITNGYNANLSISYIVVGESGEINTIKIQNQSVTTSVPVKDFASLALYGGNQIILTIPRTDLLFTNKVNCEVVATRIAGDNTNVNIIVTIADTTAAASFTINKA